MAAISDPETEAEQLVFHAILRPHRSLGPRGLAFVIGFSAICLSLIALPFLIAGAWPIVGFLGLDAALLCLAFHVNAAEARNEEQIFLSRILLLIRQLDWRGARRETKFNPCWLRLERKEHPEWGLERLSVVQGRQREVIGACLNPEDRADFARALSAALAEVRR